MIIYLKKNYLNIPIYCLSFAKNYIFDVTAFLIKVGSKPIQIIMKFLITIGTRYFLSTFFPISHYLAIYL